MFEATFWGSEFIRIAERVFLAAYNQLSRNILEDLLGRTICGHLSVVVYFGGVIVVVVRLVRKGDLAPAGSPCFGLMLFVSAPG